MKTFKVKVNMIFSGTVEIEAETLSEAKARARIQKLMVSELDKIENIKHVKTSVTDAEEVV